MERKFGKFFPENVSYENFMGPPTEPFASWFQVLSVWLADQIERMTGYRYRLMIGTEIELLIFSPSFDSRVHSVNDPDNNPNYSQNHLNVVYDLAETIALDPSKGGLGDVVCSNVTRERIFMEIRTIPTDVIGYLEAMSKIREYFQREAKRRRFNPVVYSQHIHFSLTNKRGGNFFEKRQNMLFVEEGLVDVYRRCFPLLRLPEEVEEGRIQHQPFLGLRDNGFKRRKNDPYRVEARLNSSEYAFDPFLNLVINLLGIYNGLREKEKRNKNLRGIMDKLRARGKIDPPNSFCIDSDFNTLIRELERDEILNQYFPEEVINALCKIILIYWNISTGKKTVAQAREESYRIAENIDPDMLFV